MLQRAPADTTPRVAEDRIALLSEVERREAEQRGMGRARAVLQRFEKSQRYAGNTTHSGPYHTHTHLIKCSFRASSVR